jgi:hypothetical protein
MIVSYEFEKDGETVLAYFKIQLQEFTWKLQKLLLG